MARDQEMQQLLEKAVADLRALAGSDIAARDQAAANFVKAVETPLRKVLLSGDVIGGVFTPQDYTNNPRVEYPIDFLTPGGEKEHYAYVVPGQGRIPEKRVEGDYLMVPTYMIGNSIDCTLRYLRDANWPVLNRMLEVLEAGFVKKMNDDGWQTILAAAADRNILINDPNAAAGQFTPRLITLLKTFMRRNGGGNSGTMNRSRVTDIFMSPEAQDDVRAWDLSIVPDGVREAIYYASDDSSEIINIFGVRLNAMDEFGEGQEYQLFYTNSTATGGLAGSMASNDAEICVAIDRSREDSFVMPIRENIQVFEDNTMHRRNLFGLYARGEIGFSCLDSRRCLLASI